MGQVWNYSFTVPCALLMVTLVAFYFSRPRLPIRLNRTFLGLLALQLLVMVFDVSSSLADEHYELFSPAGLYALNMAFFVLFFTRIFWFYRFTLDIIHQRSERFFALTAVPYVVSLLIVLSSPITGAVFRIEDGMYHSGPFYVTLYVCFYFYIVLSVFLICLRRKELSEGEFVSALAYNVVLAAGNVVRFLFPFLLAMNTFCMVAIVIIYLEFLNPDLYLTNQGPAFNMRGFGLVLADLSERKECQVLGFVLKNYNYERRILGARQMDQVLGQVVTHVSESFPGMLLFYLRSGRFALLRTGATDWDMVRNQIRDRFSQSWQTEHIDLSLNIRFTFASAEPGVKDAEGIVADILIGLDEARETVDYGVAQDALMLSDTTTVNRHVDVFRSLERALDRNEVEVFLQPIVDGATREVIAAEALARIRNVSGQIIEPGLFIPLAEKSGYIGRLGDQVLEKTCEFIASHDMEALNLGWVNINLSPIQCMQQDVAERIMPVLERYRVPAQRIHLELTEESMVDYELLERQLMALKRNGFELVLDDFGSGYSNLTRVRHYPFANIKIDREVVWDYSRAQDDLLSAIVQGFRRMGYTVTAEGVETAEMAELLTAIGVDYLQGFYFCEPLPAEEFVRKYGSVN